MSISQPKKPRNDFLVRKLNAILPNTRTGDRIFSYIDFHRKNRRFPKRSSQYTMYNDAMYYLKTSEELLNPLRVFVSDKEYVKFYIKSVIGDKYNVPTLKILETAEDIDAYAFPSDCCIKPTHSSGMVVFREGGEPLNLHGIKNWLRLNYYKRLREPNYQYLKPKIIVEPLIFSSTSPADYKVYCYNGVPKAIAVVQDRQTSHKNLLLDAEWNALGYSIRYPLYEGDLEKPENFDEMMDVSRKLSKAFDGFIRVDLYSNGKELKVGELTNLSGGAESIFLPASAEGKFARLLFE